MEPKLFVMQSKPCANERGQAIVLVLLALGIFLLGAVALAVDFTNLWFHRQAAQSAGDAACAAGAMDMLQLANGTANTVNLDPPNDFDCSAGTSKTPCWYANQNGYSSSLTKTAVSSSGNTAGNNVSGTYPAANNSSGSICPSGSTCPAPGATPPAMGVLPSAWNTKPYLRIDIVDRVEVYFLGLLNGSRTVDVRTFSVCGLIAPSPGPSLIVLNPTASSVIKMNSSAVTIVGGPQRGIQMNSCAGSGAAGCSNNDPLNGGSSAHLYLNAGGPTGNGADIGTVGIQGTIPTWFNGGTNGSWLNSVSLVGDVLASLSAPSTTGMTDQSGSTALGQIKNHGYKNTKTTDGNATENGCPDAINGCDEFSGGNYSNGIDISNSSGGDRTYIFDPGIYYITNGFSVGQNACIRPSTATGDGSGGTIFYFSDSNSISVASNASDCTYLTTNDTTNHGHFFTTTGGVTGYGVGCTASSTIPSNLKDLHASGAGYVTGSVLLAPCTAPGGTAGIYGDPAGTTNPLGEQRGLLFFQNRATNPVGSHAPTWSAPGEFLLGGIVYFHQCVASGSDIGTGCSTASAYNTTFTFSGGSGTYFGYFLGNIIVDQLQFGGSSFLTLDLVINYSWNALKASLLR